MKAFSEHPLARKIAIMTAIKLVGLLAIWWLFFNEPSSNALTSEQVSSAILHPVTRSITTP